MVSSQDLDLNLKRAEQLIDDLRGSDVQAIFLPENFSALAHHDPRVLGEAEVDSKGPVRQFLSEMARRLASWIFAGTIPVAVRPDGSKVDGRRVRAASLVLDHDGQEIARYDKLHMFDVEVADSHRHYLESATFECGETLQVVDAPIGSVGLSVCYDLRFPELYRQLVASGAQHLAVPSAFTTTTGKAHWELLMRARAVENACFTIGACQGGRHDSGRQTYGHSMVAGPWGDVLGKLGDGEGVLSVCLDLDDQARIRREMPTLLQRKLR